MGRGGGLRRTGGVAQGLARFAQAIQQRQLIAGRP